MTWVILTISLWENPHCDEPFNTRDFLSNRIRFPTDFVAIFYKGCSRDARRKK